MENYTFLIDDEFVLEEIHRYKLTVTINGKSAINTSNSFELLKTTYDEVIRDTITSDDDVKISIYDYDLNTDIETYDSETDRC